MTAPAITSPPPSRHRLEQLARDGALTADGLEIALRRLDYLPNTAAWRRFANLALLAAGSLLVLAGIVFFFAFNWDALHRYAKMGLVALPLFLSVALAARFAGQRTGQAWLGAAVVLAGVLLAVIGQIYQTGADSELLFAGWALLTLPWVLAGRAPWLWLFWLLLLNVALGLFVSGRMGMFIFMDSSRNDGLLWLPLLLNAAALGVCEGLRPRIGWLRNAVYAPRAIALLAALFATALGVIWSFEMGRAHWQVMRYTPLLYLVWLGVTVWFYQVRQRDIVPLAAAALSLVVVVTAGLGRWLLDRERGEPAGSFFIIGLAVAALTALAAAWLRRTVQAWETPAPDTAREGDT